MTARKARKVVPPPPPPLPAPPAGNYISNNMVHFAAAPMNEHSARVIEALANAATANANAIAENARAIAKVAEFAKGGPAYGIYVEAQR